LDEWIFAMQLKRRTALSRPSFESSRYE